jgi:excinuclease ABC subunit C
MSVDKNDDYHMMIEAVYRRYFRLLTERENLPDLIFVDGGENQMTACKEALTRLGISIPICGLKKDEHHRTKTLLDTNQLPIDLTNESDVFNLLTRIQDEVHRYAISYHKQIRSKGALSSVLDNVEGIGEKRKKLLLKTYGSLEKIKNAEPNELAKIIPYDIAISLQAYLKENTK